MSSWNLADCLDAITEILGAEEALVQGTRRLSWSQLDRRTRNLAAWMLEQGVSHQGKLAIYTYNHTAYMESVYAGFKATMVPVNVNYRYREEELLYLLDNADAEVVVVHEDFVPLLGRIRGSLPKLRAVLVVFDRDEGDSSPLDGAESFERVAETDRPAPRVSRSGDDMMFLYTGGTTGMPKGAMWRQDDLYHRFAGGILGAAPADMEAYITHVRNLPVRLRTLVGPDLALGCQQRLVALLAGDEATEGPGLSAPAVLRVQAQHVDMPLGKLNRRPVVHGDVLLLDLPLWRIRETIRPAVVAM